MKRIYIDESIHDRGDFIVIASVCTDHDIDADVHKALAECGFVPCRDEFKSSMKMAGNDAAQEMRARLKFLLMQKCRLAIAVCPISERNRIIAISGELIASIAPEDRTPPGTVYFDEGMKKQELTLPVGWNMELDCDSRQVAGIQIADCAAHIASIILLSEMGIINKMVESGEHYPEPEVEMAWQLWTSLRYSLSSGRPVGGYDEDGWCEPMMAPFGLLVSEGCSDAVKAAVEQRLGAVWVGCIH